MKITHVAEYASGGVATYLRNTIAYQLDCDDIETIDLFISNFNSENINFNSEKFRIHRYDYHRNIKGIIQLLKIVPDIVKVKSDVIHFHSTFAGLLRPFIKFASWKQKVLIVYTSHGWSFFKEDIGNFQKVIFIIIENILSYFTNLIINVSRHDYPISTKYGISKKKSTFIYNTIKPEVKPLPVKNPFTKVNTYKICFIGRFDKAKGLDFLLNSFDFDHSNIEIMIIGKAVLNDAQINTSNTEHIHFVGWINNNELDSYIRLCDAVVIPSRWEAFGLTALEAMKNSKLVISSNAGGLPEIVKTGYNGFVFQKEDKYSLIATLKKFQKLDSKDIDIMDQHAHQTFIKKFNYEKNNADLIKIYEDGVKNA
ncbi:glycosyltransferase family 4 protein [Bombilactobacillus bombi]|uniref:glycosyltransferase family 4 protein n=1 Tax=Bombilactobacillus bombi TaxID=1303590 RepID=UPI0015E5CBC7|nr:glycosyltransferase family 4 protein [Bombilactobacillus bombi]MBA1434938.1 glycosyltransferase family 1 protein [Bombilactobacillus bombi]